MQFASNFIGQQPPTFFKSRNLSVEKFPLKNYSIYNLNKCYFYMPKKRVSAYRIINIGNSICPNQSFQIISESKRSLKAQIWHPPFDKNTNLSARKISRVKIRHPTNHKSTILYATIQTGGADLNNSFVSLTWVILSSLLNTTQTQAFTYFLRSPPNKRNTNTLPSQAFASVSPTLHCSSQAVLHSGSTRLSWSR